MVTCEIFITFDYATIEYHFPTLDLMLTAVMGGSDMYIADGFNDFIHDKPYLQDQYLDLRQMAERAMPYFYKAVMVDNIEDVFMGPWLLIDARAVGECSCLIFKKDEE